MAANDEIPDWLRDVAANTPPMATIPEARAVLRLGDTRVRQLIAGGELRAVRGTMGGGGAKLIIPRSELVRWLRDHQVRP